MVSPQKRVRKPLTMPSGRSIAIFICGYLVATFLNNLQKFDVGIKQKNDVSTLTEEPSPGKIDPVPERAVGKIINGSPLISDSCDPSDVPDKYKVMFGSEIEVYTPFHEYFAKTILENCEDCLRAHKWVPYFEAYHDRFKRFRNREEGVTFMEIGVQSGGSIAMWREYFGESFTYIGLDINPEVQRFDNADWINIHVGDSGDPVFLQKIRELYPDGVDILLDDGGHIMEQQIKNFQMMTDFVKPDGIFACEDLATSWSPQFGGVRNGGVTSSEFVNKTMIGRIHYAIDWLHAGFFKGNQMATSRTSDERPQDLYPDMPEYRSFIRDFKSIHVFNQIVFFERGTYSQIHLKTHGTTIPYSAKRGYSGYKLPWEKVEDGLTQLLEKDKLTCATN